jgi:hypothetical protein
MKKITFLVACLLVMNTTLVEAKSKSLEVTRHRGYAVDYRDAEPIYLVERGISFYVFPNGEFDFNTSRSNGPRDTYYRGTGRRGDVTPEADRRGNRPVRIEYDFDGRVRRIGNVFLNYDFFGRIKRIGTVSMSYNSFALKRIGGMRLYYNFRGEIVGVAGFINYNNSGYDYNPCPAGYNDWDDNDDWDDEDDNDYYYYKKDGTKEKMKKEDVEEIKRETTERKKES